MIARVSIPPDLLEEIRRHAASTYPEECCGFLIGEASESHRTIHRISPAPNRVASERERRYVIPPDELRSLETELEGSGAQVLGFYHSHPDHPARPSRFDRDHAWPWYTYVVVNVTQEGAGTAGAFELDADSLEFREVPIALHGPSPQPLSNGGVSESS
jgi:proteasome lid subunit RPN8/RPN11